MERAEGRDQPRQARRLIRRSFTVFADPLARLEDDDRHSDSEQRLILLGRSSADRLLAVMFTDRGAERVRVISARQATRAERTQYEEAYR